MHVIISVTILISVSTELHSVEKFKVLFLGRKPIK